MPSTTELENARKLTAVGLTGQQAASIAAEVEAAKVGRLTHANTFKAAGFTDAQADTLARLINNLALGRRTV
jgi:hypothetical protein